MRKCTLQASNRRRAWGSARLPTISVLSSLYISACGSRTGVAEDEFAAAGVFGVAGIPGGVQTSAAVATGGVRQSGANGSSRNDATGGTTTHGEVTISSSRVILSGTAGHVNATAGARSGGNGTTGLGGTGTMGLGGTRGSSVSSEIAGGGAGPFCGAKQTACGNGESAQCVDLQTDLNHCGECEVACPTDATCIDGACKLASCKNATFFLGTLGPTPVGRKPVSAVVGDWNGDGKADIATANSGDNAVSVLVGLGNGQFSGRQDFATGQSPSAIVSCDLDGDDKLDLVTANSQSGTLTVLLGIGNGAFANGVDYQTGSNPHSLVAADFDHDGYQDIAVANTAGQSVSILLGQGGGTLAAKVDYELGVAPTALVAGDLNGDGVLDLATGNVGTSMIVQVLLGNANGTFVIGPAKDSPNEGIQAAALGDLNGDSHLDLALVRPTDALQSSVLILDGNADASFGADTPVGNLDGAHAIVLADLNGDGRSDLAATEDGAINVALGQSNGSLGPIARYVTTGSASLVSSDLNCDGRPDLITTDSELDQLSVLLATRYGGFTQFHSGSEHSLLRSLRDVNGDKFVDLIYVTASVSVFLGTGRGTFASATEYASIEPTGMDAGDINGDGDIDLLFARGNDEPMGVLLGTGAGAFAAIADIDAGNEEVVALGDLNGDGILDLIAGKERINAVGVYLGLGAGKFAARQDYRIATKPRWLGLGDFNRDGKLDVIASNNIRGVSVLLGSGDGTLRAAQDYELLHQQSRPVLGDLNRDGRPDLVTVNSDAASISVYLSKADGTLDVRHDYATPAGVAREAEIGDLDGDSVLDVAVRSNEGTLVVFFGAGDGSLACMTEFGPSGSFSLSDVDGDSRTDVVSVELGSPEVLLNHSLVANACY